MIDTKPNVSKRTIAMHWLLAGLTAIASVSAATAQQPQIQTQRQPPQTVEQVRVPPAAPPPVAAAFRFEQPHRVEIEGVTLPADTRVTSTVTARIDVLAVRSGNDNTVRLAPGLASYQTIRLSGSLPVSATTFAWFEQTRTQVEQRRAGSVIILNRNAEELQRFNFFEAFPVGFEIDIPESRWHLTIAFEWLEQG
jgi:hypothetical protein